MSSLSKVSARSSRKQEHRESRRTGLFAGVSVLLALVLAACSSAVPTTGMPVPGDTPVSEMIVSPSVSVMDQAVADGKVTIAQVVSEGPGWLVVHARADGAPGPVLGYTAVADGTNADVAVELDLTGATGTLYAMLHTDAGTAGTYEFPGDDKPVSVDDAIVMTPFSLQAAEGQVEVRMVDFAFAQASLFVRAGSTVTWINEDGARHTVTSDTGIWDSGLFDRGNSFSFTFDEPGVYPYYCRPHGGPGSEGMAGTIVVLPALG